MSTPITINFYEDLPCDGWKNTPAEIKKCPMKTHWQEGQEVMCMECGHLIYYNGEQHSSDYQTKADK